LLCTDCLFEDKIESSSTVSAKNYSLEKLKEWIDIKDKYEAIVGKLKHKHEAEKDLLQTKIKQLVNQRGDELMP
jgi:predicted nuclease with TOPRIM domain